MFEGGNSGDPNRSHRAGAAAARSLERRREKRRVRGGWRLPSIKELTWIVEREQFESALARATWPGSPSEIYWTSTPEVRTPNLAWAIDFTRGAGLVAPRTSAHVMRLVHAVRP